jgi:hypothetical protein|tara:strand:- start:5251 stop:5505 length:255 start_codon:yes stop_codon:yes gene_type:complete
MIDLILIISSGVGLTFIVTRSNIFKTIREWVTYRNKGFGELITCPQCFGLYSGFASYLLVRFNLDILVYGLIVSLVCFILNKKI